MNNSKNSKKKKQTKQLTTGQNLVRVLKSKRFGIALATIELVLSVVLIGMLMYLNILPLKYFLPAAIALLVIGAYLMCCMFLKKFRGFAKVIAFILSIIMAVGIYYVGYANGTFDKIGGADTKTDVVNVYVLKEDAASTIKDAAGYNFGILGNLDKDNTEKTIEDINKEIKGNMTTTEKSTIQDLVDVLYNGDVQAIIMNQAYASAIKDVDGYTDFEDVTKVIYKKTIKTKINKAENIDVTNNTFTVFISGIDTDGAVSTTSRSDVNILAVINPDTKEILLINTPRDYYVPLSISNGVPDKLTHAGIYGVNVSMDTLGLLYDTDVNYYFRLNFTGFTGIIDALGGITVHSDYAFTTLHGGDQIVAGDNYLSGTQALGFVRERYSLSGGDNQRGKNQMAMISAVVKKMASPAILNNYAGLMNSISDSFETSLSSAQISSLVRMQLNEGGAWNVQQYAVTGTGDSAGCYSLASGTNAYVMRPNVTTVEKAKELINNVYNGEAISATDVAQ